MNAGEKDEKSKKMSTAGFLIPTGDSRLEEIEIREIIKPETAINSTANEKKLINKLV